MITIARVTYVESARASKNKRSCCKCGTAIEVGSSYKWFATRIGTSGQRKNFCTECPIKQSDRTSSHHLGTLYRAVEDAEDSLSSVVDPSLEDIATIVREAAEQVKEVSEGYQESADNIVDGFGHETAMSEEIQGKGDDLETFADELDGAADDIEGLDDPEEDEQSILDEFDGDVDDEGKPIHADEGQCFVEEVREARREAALQQANEALCGCPL